MLKDKSVLVIERVRIKRLVTDARGQVLEDGKQRLPTLKVIARIHPTEYDEGNTSQSRRPAHEGNPSRDFSLPGIESSQLRKLIDKRALELKASVERAKTNLVKNTDKSKTKYVISDNTIDDSDQRAHNERTRFLADPDIQKLAKKFPENLELRMQ